MSYFLGEKFINTKKNNLRKTHNENQKIIITKDGPYLVCGSVPLLQKIINYDRKWDSCEWQDDKTYPLQKTYSLCRCGQSKNKPYCDGTHKKVTFKGSETADHKTYVEKAVELNGPGLKLTDEKDLCASARFCHRAGGIWTLIQTSDKPGDRKIVIEEAADCPSGRLVVSDKKTGEVIEPQFEPSIVLIEDPSMGVSGPIWVRGGIPIISVDGKPYEIRNRVTLCRCGKSTNKPFCDSSHYPE
jgi:CDGSH-type Zn-finger protein